MLAIDFRRESVCMGDDAGNGRYTIQMPDDAALGDLAEVILHGGRGNDWPIPYTGADRQWIVRSNIGDLAHIYTDADGGWHIQYGNIPPDTPLKGLGIQWTFGART